MRLRHLASAAAIVISFAGVGVATAAPASAASSDCAQGYTCMWGNTGYTTTANGCTGGGDWVRFQYYISDFTGYYFCWSGGQYFWANDHIASVFNQGTQCSSGLYIHAGYGSLAVTTSRGTGWTNLAGSGKRTDLSSGQFIC